MIGLGMLSLDVLGASTVVGGLACTPTGPATLAVSVGVGRIYSLQNVDNTAYSTLGTNTTTQILKQGMLVTPVTLACAAPVTAGYSVNYLVEAIYTDVDAGTTVLPYYNAALPGNAWSGPNNTGAAQPTIRQGRITLQAKSGIAAPSGTQTTPAADSGYVGLWIVTVAFGAASVVSGNIVQAPGAPFIVPTLLNAMTQSTADLRYKKLYSQTPAETVAGVTPSDTSFPELAPHRYGMDFTSGTASDAAFARMISVAQQYNNAHIDFPQGAAVVFASPITWDTNKVSIAFNGTTLSWPTFASGHAMPLTSGNSNVNLAAILSGSKPITGGIFVGPGVGVTGADCLYLNDTSTFSRANLKFVNCGWREWATDVTFGAGAFCDSFDSCTFTLTAGVATTYSVIQLNSGTSGERQSFRDCFWYNRQLLINNQSGQCDMYFQNCSLDYATRYLTTSGGSVFFNGCHIEGNSDTANWFTATGTASVVITGGEIVLTAAKNNFDMFYSDSTDTSGGISISDCVLGFGGGSITSYLIGGTGAAQVRNLRQSAVKPVIGKSTNLLAYPDFESTNWANDWTLGGTTIPTQSTAQAHSGTKSMLLAGTTSNQPTATAKRPCLPGQNMTGEFWYIAPSFASGTFAASLAYVDAAGTALGQTGATNTTLTVTAAVGAWTRVQYSLTIPAPFGTAAAVLSFQVFGVTTGTQSAYVDDVIVNVV